LRLDTSAFLAVLLASTGFSQTEAAALLQVDGRTVRRWAEGTRPTPKFAIERLRAWAYALDQTAEGIIMRKGVPAVLLLYRRDRDVPPWTGLRTAGCHLALVRRVFERRPDVQLIAFDRPAYRYWLGARSDSEEMRDAWAASRVYPR
jgi:transcriptional regulator with XRE-family HTH domain